MVLNKQNMFQEKKCIKVHGETFHSKNMFYFIMIILKNIRDRGKIEVQW